jgi:hypothetical protein
MATRIQLEIAIVARIPISEQLLYMIPIVGLVSFKELADCVVDF